MTALIERLQDQADEDRLNDEPEIAELWEKAIAEIERLTAELQRPPTARAADYCHGHDLLKAENQRLREALELK